MGASIYYRVIEPKELHIDVAAPSSFIEAMTKVFGSYPWRLKQTCIPSLRGMAALSCDGAAVNPYEAIIAILESGGDFSEIEVWPEY